MTKKNCNRCGALKAASEFSPDKRAKDGRQGRCRECCGAAKREKYHSNPEAAREKRRAYYSENRDLVLANNAKSREKNRESILKRKRDYYERVKLDPEWQERQKQKRLGRREEKAEYDKKYNARNSERIAKRTAEWNKNNRDKRRAIVSSYDARRRSIEGCGISGPELEHWRDAQPKVCHWCGSNCEDDYHVDHYMPLARGGKHEVRNLVISCPTCNIKKSAKHPAEFAASIGRLL